MDKLGILFFCTKPTLAICLKAQLVQYNYLKI